MTTIRNFGADDIEFALELVRIAGWNQVRQDIVRTLSLDPDGSFLAEIDGRRAGIATTTSFGRLGWIAFMIVHPDFRGQGLAKLLMTKSIEYLKEKGILSIKLDATPMGFPVYKKMGFVEECRLSRVEVKCVNEYAFVNEHTFVSESAPPGKVFKLKDKKAMKDRIVEYDGRHFGYCRKEMIRMLLEEETSKCFCYADNDGIRGYLAMRPGRIAWYVGPWIADSAEIAEDLIIGAIGDVKGQIAFIDIFQNNTACGGIVEKFGFTFQRELIRMYLGENITSNDPGKVYGIFGPEKG